MATVFIPTLLQAAMGGAKEVDVPGATVRQIVENLERLHPGIQAKLMDGGKLKPNISVAVDGEVSPAGLLEPVAPSSEVHFVTAIKGGMSSFCVHCGAKLHPDQRFCVKCGATVDAEFREEPEEAPPPLTIVPPEAPVQPVLKPPPAPIPDLFTPRAKPEPAPPPKPPEPPAETFKTRAGVPPTVLAAAAGVVVALLGGGGWWWSQRTPAPTAGPTPSETAAVVALPAPPPPSPEPAPPTVPTTVTAEPIPTPEPKPTPPVLREPKREPPRLTKPVITLPPPSISVPVATPAPPKLAPPQLAQPPPPSIQPEPVKPPAPAPRPEPEPRVATAPAPTPPPPPSKPAYTGPPSGVFNYSGPGIIQNGEVLVPGLPPGALRLDYDRDKWDHYFVPEPGGTQKLVLRSKRPGTQKKLQVKWERDK